MLKIVRKTLRMRMEMELINKFFLEIYELLFISSIIYNIYIILLFLIKWRARFVLKLTNEKFSLNKKELLFLLLSITIIFGYIL